jgi:hypothetical protein
MKGMKQRIPMVNINKNANSTKNFQLKTKQLPDRAVGLGESFTV